MQYSIAMFNILLLEKFYMLGKCVFLITICVMLSITHTNSYFCNFVYAQNTITIDLEASPASSGGMMSMVEGSYDLVGIYGNGTGLQGLQIGSGGFPYASITEANILLSFPLKSPDPNNPKKVTVSEELIDLSIGSIEERDNGITVYNAKPSYSGSATILDHNIDQAVLAKKGHQASLFLHLE